MSDLVYSTPGGRLVVDIDSLTLVNNTLKSHKITVPADERWVLLTAKAVNCDDVTRTTKIVLYNEAGLTNLIITLAYKTDLGAGSVLCWPNSITGAEGYIARPTLIVLETGHTIEFNFAAGGASAGATDADGIVITYLKVPN